MSPNPGAEPVILRPVVDSRPPARRWVPTDGAGPDGAHQGEVAAAQPSLLEFAADVLDQAGNPPRPRGVRVHAGTGRGSPRPAAGLPEPAGWSAVLGLAIGQAIVGARPVGQLESWLTAPLLADLRCAVRQPHRGRPRPVGSGPSGPAVAVASVRTQCLTPTSVETTIHLRVGPDPMVLGARLEATGRRWLCTELVRLPVPGPSRAVPRVSALRPARDTA